MGRTKSKPRPPDENCKANQSSIHPDLLPRVYFLWAKSHSVLYSKMSNNIAREICLYVGKFPELLYYEDSVMYKVSPVKRTKEAFFEIHCMLGHGSVCSAVFMGRDDVFLILRDCTSAYEDFPYYAVFKGSVHTLQGAQEERFQCAVLYDSVRDCVYIFGGHGTTNTRDYQVSQVAEKFNPSGCSIEQLPDMLQPRAAFGVCWHLHLVYLCGGTHSSIETFNPLTLTYTIVSILSEEAMDIAAFSSLGSLYLLNNSAIWTENAGKVQKTVLTSTTEPADWWQSPYFVSVQGSKCYLLCINKCVSIDLLTLTDTAYDLSPVPQAYSQLVT